MAELTQSEIHPFIRKIETIALFALSEAERAALAALPMQVAVLEPYQDIVREHERPARSFAMLEGLTCTYKTTRAGKRQVMAYHVPGDVPDFQSLHLEVLDISIGTVTPCRVGFVRHETLRALFRAHPRLVDAFWRATLIDAGLCREWMLNNGRRESYARMAHLFCELLMRLEAVGLAQGNACELGLTQPELGDALGISTVHVSRTLKELREAGLITLSGGRLAVHDRARLAAAAEFDPTYLHLRDPKTH
ncbi:Crp/Fnr family transcriptional regulator [Methylobacterium sp. NEAU 140]|uniref:Crp/Fnr family transcriptional regulator n=1 Tax=Methylobacterium sp. NEAU 140 TaxID=3064945 RepID=UPI0027328D47|nr:Crp/Fnr family transcriptional regulator [Methylobacterium sp. NEAU 140]MDP4024886.1 Crp/Fnr family transcriptional regulator [Methylobacterium sp. NEAU 140]